MSEDEELETRRTWLMVLGAAWLLAWAGSFAVFVVMTPSSDSLGRGVNQAVAFLGLQSVAIALSIPIWRLGRVWSTRASIRRLSRVPVILAALFLTLPVLVLLWARLS